ncbi:hypothetical protein LINGRAHAP2_LOCUS2131, partial [Linum grandiflorum]
MGYIPSLLLFSKKVLLLKSTRPSRYQFGTNDSDMPTWKMSREFCAVIIYRFPISVFQLFVRTVVLEKCTNNLFPFRNFRPR